MGCPFHPVKLIIPLVGSPFTGYVFAVAGLEPATCFRFSRNPLVPTELHGTIYIERPHRKLLEATPARNPAALLGLHQSFVSSVKYPHSCGSFGFHSLPPFPRPYTTTFPHYSLHFGAISWLLRGSELTLSPLAVLTDLVPSFPLLQLVGLFRCRFDFCNVQACALAAYSPQ